MRIIPRLVAPLLLLTLIPVGVRSQGGIPTPESVLGFQPGADYKLATYDQVVAYFQKVDAASDRMVMMQAGKTSQGRTFQFAIISSKDNLSKLDRYREIARRLAHPEGMTDEQARALAREGKAVVHIDGGLHATEIAGPQQTPQLLYDLLSRADQPEMKPIFDNVIFMLWPTINPDGMQMVTDWYMTHFDPTNPTQTSGLPTLYQEYVGHDNNRDAYMLNMIESRVMEHTWRAWEPNIIYVQHQSPPNPYRIWLPPFAEPIALHAPPIASAQTNMIGMAIAQGLSQHNQPGAVHMLSTYDAWYPGYIDYFSIFKNVPSFWTETAGASAVPSRVNASDVQREPKALYVDPFPGGEWNLRKAVEYDETAALSVLGYAARYKDDLLFGRYQGGRDQIKQGRNAAPYAYLISPDQRDPVAAVELLRRLAFSGVRVYQFSDEMSIPFNTSGDGIAAIACPAGTWIIPTDQEFAAVVRELLDPQRYPDVRESPNGPIDQPYDAAGWTMPIAMGVTVTTVNVPVAAGIRAKMKLLGPLPEPKAKPTPYNMNASADAAPFDSAPGIGFDSSPAAAAIVPPAGKITGSGRALALNASENNTFRAINRAWKSGLEAQYLASPFSSGSKYLIAGMSESDQDAMVKSLALRAERVNTNGVPIKRPRIAVLNAPNSMDEGWTRWVLEQYGFEFVPLPLAEIGNGPLRDRIDVLVLPDDARLTDAGGGRGGGGRGARAGGGGVAGGRAGGAGAGGAGGDAPPDTPDPRVKALDDFVHAGGTVVCFNRASSTVIDQLKLPVKNAIAGLGRQQVFVGGSLLKVTVDPTQRVMAGMPADAAVFYDSGPVFETQEGFKGAVLAKYPSEGSLLLSGYLLGEQYFHGKAAALDVEVGSGHVVLIGFRPQWRGQPFGTFRVIFNALMR